MSETEFVTFGCRLNTYETEVMRNHAAAAGKSNAIVFNTCAVTAEAARQARQAIRKAKAGNPQAEIIVTGCAAQTDPDMFARMPEVSRVLGNEEKLKAASWRHGANARVSVSGIMDVKTATPHLIDGLKERTRAFVQVQNGCDHRCTFCIIPFGRGNSRSLQAGDVVEQVRRLAASGYCEVVLTGVDLTSWGADLEGAPKLGHLANRILKTVPELRRLRLSSIDMIEADPELMDVIAGEERVMPHIHLSLQSGDNMILKRMKRRHAREDSTGFCAALRARRPGIVFGADIIAGFPTETEDMFGNSLRIIDDCGLTYLHVFPFSPRPGTPAARMPQLEKRIIKERAALLRQKGEQRLDRFLASEIGAIRQVLVETEAMGRTEHFAPVKFASRMAPGAIVTAQVTGRGRTHLEARPAA
ncbi:tRNA (N(6)-L-threonylcarbamoyladenosine(37)-C(2))-methylthiotransferase MtaB [Aestuariivirga sp.]|uniref:tRNA (N(6)-L-threonylcarbamoyladenosine(37)-C(2))- methylthiotransferase MtaB n=1 Tax=Aestuariivirga sp. TaxID=2650926 RepID=UPI0025BC5113|nr:tRNA (N(6)-L-threonylcarbamoyladenosine(37)-C(2))-methylthiotransferase MtaB [Aestuariivirga sp.]MCA3555909.1 tRNA (N(6)-L-threonylcarbamoyladenosine(37)-C(2))-methylthiotransferase MtaB [Aestuariivirga sp.]